MKITDVRARIVEVKQQPEVFYHSLWGRRRPIPLPAPLGRPPVYTYDYVPDPNLTPYRFSFLEVLTDEGVTGFCSGGGNLSPNSLAMVKALIVGRNPFHREEIWQVLHAADRLLHVRPGLAAAVDDCLWDLAGRALGLPVYRVIGAVREKVPAYWSAMDVPQEQNVEDALQAKAEGYHGYKFHSYKGWEADLTNFRAVRQAVGDDLRLMQDAAATYTVREALRVGRVLEELGFYWFEEPIPDQDVAELQQLVRELEIPIIATESFTAEMHRLAAQYLRAGATDILRGSGGSGITTLLKLAHLAEMFNTNIELVSGGPFFGLVHAHALCAIANSDFYEDWRNQRQLGQDCGVLNAPVAEGGYIVPPAGPGFGAEVDWDWLNKITVAQF